MNLWQRMQQALGLNLSMEGEMGDHFYGSNALPWSVDQTPSDHSGTPNLAPDKSGNRIPGTAPPAISDHSPNNVIGWPGLMAAPTEFVLLQPRSFAEIPQAVQALRQCKSIVLNLCFLDPDQAQRCADYVAGGTFAIDGHQQRLDETIFLFTPNFIQISHPCPDHSSIDEFSQPPEQFSVPDQPLNSPSVSLDTYDPLPLAD